MPDEPESRIIKITAGRKAYKTTEAVEAAVKSYTALSPRERGYFKAIITNIRAKNPPTPEPHDEPA